MLAFGSLVAASLPLMLTIVGLIASAGVLYLGTLFADISIWSMNFALMFALALGIDYALFIVVRYRAAHFGHGLSPADAAGVAMDTAGKAVLFSGITVLISLSAVMLVPSPAFRSMALGIMVSVVFILAATLTLLPAVLGALGSKVDNLSLKWVHSGEHRSPAFAALGRARLGQAPALRHPRAARPARPRRSRDGPQDRHAVDQGRPDQRQLAHRLHPGAGRVRPRRARAHSSSSRPPPTPRRSRTTAERRPRHRERHADPDLERRPPRAGAGDPAPEPLRPRRRPTPSTGSAPRCPPERSSAARPPRTTTSRPRSRTPPRS